MLFTPENSGSRWIRLVHTTQVISNVTLDSWELNGLFEVETDALSTALMTWTLHSAEHPDASAVPSSKTATSASINATCQRCKCRCRAAHWTAKDPESTYRTSSVGSSTCRRPAQLRRTVGRTLSVSQACCSLDGGRSLLTRPLSLSLRFKTIFIGTITHWVDTSVLIFMGLDRTSSPSYTDQTAPQGFAQNQPEDVMMGVGVHTGEHTQKKTTCHGGFHKTDSIK